jgi:hypothetical protein
MTPDPISISCRSSTTSCGESPPATSAGSAPDRPCRPPRSSTRPSSAWRPSGRASSPTARARRAAKRGGAPQRVTLDDGNLADAGAGSSRPDRIDVLALDQALSRLAVLDPEQARIIELRYFGGLTLEETAEAAGVSLATVKRQFAMARAWLKRALEGDPPGAGG